MLLTHSLRSPVCSRPEKQMGAEFADYAKGTNLDCGNNNVVLLLLTKREPDQTTKKPWSLCCRGNECSTQ